MPNKTQKSNVTKRQINLQNLKPQETQLSHFLKSPSKRNSPSVCSCQKTSATQNTSVTTISKKQQQKTNNLSRQNFAISFALKRKVYLCLKKRTINLEEKPKNKEFASHGDFRRYLYEAPVMSIPTDKGKGE